MKIAVIADIHSNSHALSAVLDDMKKVQVDRVIHLGDALNGPVDPCAVARLLKSCDAIHVRGNGERMILSNDAKVAKSAVFARTRLSSEDMAYIESWPNVYREEGLLACHGSPRSDVEYLLEEVTLAGVSIKEAGGISNILGEDCPSLVLCGHTHIPRVVCLPTGCIVVNPGSVGLPAYSDQAPVPHKMETGSPHARYAILERTSSGWVTSLRAVPYDWEQAAATAMQNGFQEWVHALRTGYVQG